jgi:hypothetical protein
LIDSNDTFPPLVAQQKNEIQDNPSFQYYVKNNDRKMRDN